MMKGISIFLFSVMASLVATALAAPQLNQLTIRVGGFFIYRGTLS
jgi:hypothetical protein